MDLVYGILQARILDWVAIPFSMGSFQPRDWTQVSHIASDSLPAESQGKPKKTGVGNLSLLQGIFLPQESNQSLLHTLVENNQKVYNTLLSAGTRL